MSLNTNLPPTQSTDSSDEVKSFFDKFFTHEITFPAAQIDAVVGFFLKRGFEDQAAKTTAIVLLNQSRVDNVNPFVILDTLKGLNNSQLSEVVTQIMNLYREKSSALGYKIQVIEETFESRNIAQ
jgi:hypothetical protein